MSRPRRPVAANPKNVTALMPVFLDDLDLGARAAGVADIRAAHFDAGWFIDFVEAHFWDKSKDSPSFGPVVCADFQREQLGALMVVDAAGRLASLAWVVSWPRRHGKTQWCGYYEIARCLRYPNQVCVIQGASEEHADEAAFARLVETIRESPCFIGEHKRTQDSFSAVFHAREMAPATKDAPASLRDFRLDIPDGVTVDVLDGLLRFSNGSVIRSVSAKARFGVRISCYRATDLHTAKTDEAFLAGKGSTGDSWCGLAVIDSTQGDAEQIVALATEAGKAAAVTMGKEGDPSIAVSHVYYEDLRDACERGPSWLTAAFVRSQAALMTPSAFTRNHLNKATGAGEVVFPAALLRMARETKWSDRLCQERWAGAPGSYTPRAVYRAMRREFRGHGLRVGLGLDRSSGRAGRDRTVVVASALGVDPALVGKTAPVFDENGAEIDRFEMDATVVLVLAVVTVPGAGKGQIRRVIRQLVRLYGEPAMAFEEYQARDLHEWAEEQGYEATLEHMSDKAKHAHVLAITELLTTGRLALPGGEGGMRGGAGLLNVELSRYAETDGKGAVPKYGGPVGRTPLALAGHAPEQERVKDDTVEAAMWSTKPIRDADPDEWRL